MSKNFCTFAVPFLYHLSKVTPMKEPKRILFCSQEIYPYLSEETPVRLLNRQLPEYFQQNGFETRNFMPKFGDINERRNQLHEVIRLSGTNLIIEDTDYPLLIKVASIPSARMQVYFTDNDDLFHRNKGTSGDVVDSPENDNRTIFFARGVIETVKKQHWTPDIVHCSGWMAALIPLFLKRAYSDEPFFRNSKVVLMIDDKEYTVPFSTRYASKLCLLPGISPNDIRMIDGFPVGYEELMRLAIDYSDAIVFATEKINTRVQNYAATKNKPILEYSPDSSRERYLEFYRGLLAE